MWRSAEIVSSNPAMASGACVSRPPAAGLPADHAVEKALPNSATSSRVRSEIAHEGGCIGPSGMLVMVAPDCPYAAFLMEADARLLSLGDSSRENSRGVSGKSAITSYL